ncbi:MAG: hypothetical protein WA869_22750, partial [Alloacidobacterium sp.]
WMLADAALLSYVKDWKLVKSSLAHAGFDDAKPIGLDPAISTKGFSRLDPVLRPRRSCRSEERTKMIPEMLSQMKTLFPWHGTAT